MKKLIIANWKLNPTSLKDAKKLAASIETKAKNKVVICPPSVYLSSIEYPVIGSQDCFWQEKGAFTGQVSPLQLKDLGVSYCLVGHSERRLIGETDGQINFKIRTLIEHKITPVLCIGYGTTVEEDELEVIQTLRGQLELALQGVDPAAVVVAYEPVWAIGTGHNETAEHAEKVAIYVKSKFGIKKVLYGGSVKAINAKEFLDQQNIDGLLVGGASLIAKEFNQIINY